MIQKIKIPVRIPGQIISCTCGCSQKAIPVDGRLANGPDDYQGYYWECQQCHSTIYLPLKKFKQRIADEKEMKNLTYSWEV
jgi:hypothetical protein